MSAPPFTGGCLCGALRYEAKGEPRYAGLCYCRDCQRTTGSAFAGFLGFDAAEVTITGPSTSFACASARGGEARRNFCPTCHSTVFGGDREHGADVNIYAGSLDDQTQFQPKVAIFGKERPAWSPLPEGLRVFEAMPG